MFLRKKHLPFLRLFEFKKCLTKPHAVTNYSDIRQRRLPVLEHLITEYGNESIPKQLFLSNVDLHNVNINMWKNYINTLSLRGISVTNCFHIACSYPKVLDFPQKQLEDAITQWTTYGHLSIELLEVLLVHRPELLNANSKAIAERIPYLLSYSSGRDSLIGLLLLCPNLVNDDWNEILKKMSYLEEEQVVFRSEILQSKALSNSLYLIKLRFNILEKCGLYIKPNRHKHKQTKKERLLLNNPHLRDIVDTTDSVFAKNIAKITLEEYEVFEDTFFIQDDELPSDVSNYDLSDESDDEIDTNLDFEN